MPSYLLKEIANLTRADLRGDSQCCILGVMTLRNAQLGHISFFDNKRYLKQLIHTKASAVILRKEYLRYAPSNSLLVSDPYFAFAQVAQLFESPPLFTPGIHVNAIVGDHCQIHPSVSIAAYAVIGSYTCLNEGVVIGPSCILGEGVVIGKDTYLTSRVTLYAATQIGQRVIIHSGSVIGSDGFGFARGREGWVKIPQLGRVRIEDDVEIGANVTIDRGTLEDTVIESDVKLDNQIQIGHNVHIGSGTAIAGCTGIAGSTRIGKNCLIGGGVCINGHIEISDEVSITGMSSVVHSIRRPGVYSSTQSVQPQREWQKNSARLRHLDKVIRNLKNGRLKKSPYVRLDN